MLAVSHNATIFLSWAAVVVGALGYFLAARVGGRPSALQYAEAEVKRLEKQCSDDEKELIFLRSKVAQLEARTDIVKALEPLLEAMRHHESCASMRSDAMLAIMQQIADRLGADPLDAP